MSTCIKQQKREGSLEDNMKKLLDLANHLDSVGLKREADLVDLIIKAEQSSPRSDEEETKEAAKKIQSLLAQCENVMEEVMRQNIFLFGFKNHPIKEKTMQVQRDLHALLKAIKTH